METECSAYLGFLNIVIVWVTLIDTVQAVILLQMHSFPGQTLSSHKTSIFTKPSPVNVKFLPLSLCPCSSPMQSAFLAYILRSISDSTFPWYFLWLFQTMGISPIYPHLWNLLSISHELRLFVSLTVPTNSVTVCSLVITIATAQIPN